MKDLTPQEIRRAKRIQNADKRFSIEYTVGLILLIVIGTLILAKLDSIAMMQTDTLNKLNDIDVTLEPAEPTGITEEFTITHYCLENYPHICNDGDSTKTASGETPIPNYTIAADKSIPFGTKMEIDGQIYEVMDRGGNIREKRIDIAVQTHSEALSRGVIEREVSYSR